jgi:hypothetical protein
LDVETIGFCIPSVDVAKQSFKFGDFLIPNVIPNFECGEVSPQRNEPRRGKVLQSDKLVRSLDFLEFSDHRRVIDFQVRGDLLQPIPMLSERVGNPGLPILRKDPLQCRFDCF